MTPYRIPVLSAVCLLCSTAFADPSKQECVDADTDAQSQRSAGHFAAARKELRVCSSEACPQVVRDDCTQRLDEIERLQPTVVFSVKDGSGTDLVDVGLFIDGARVAEKLNGLPLPVDPGQHEVRFEVRGQAPVSRTYVLREGDRGRSESVTIGAPPPPRPTDDAPADRGATRRVLGIATGGVGVAGLVVGTVAGFVAKSSWASAQADCSSAATCAVVRATDERANALVLATVSTVGFIAGGALLAGGAILFLTALPSSRSGVAIVPSIDGSSGGLVMRGSF